MAPDKTNFGIKDFRDTTDGEILNAVSVRQMMLDLWHLLVATLR
jgi:hypothetical protein